eukprot:jgi/Bigna1/131040/aug1.13_g5748
MADCSKESTRASPAQKIVSKTETETETKAASKLLVVRLCAEDSQFIRRRFKPSLRRYPKDEVDCKEEFLEITNYYLLHVYRECPDRINWKKKSLE